MIPAIPQNLSVSLEGVNYVLLNFEFTNRELIPGGIPFVERSPEDEKARSIKNSQGSGGNVRGRQWLERGPMVTPELLSFSLGAEGFVCDKLQCSLRNPDPNRPGMVKWMVNVRFRRETFTPLPEDVAVAPSETGDENAGKALLRLMAFTWEFVHSFDNSPAGKDNVSFHFVHRKEVGEHRNALIAHGGRLQFLSAEGALALDPRAGYEFSTPAAHSMPVPAPKPPPVAKAPAPQARSASPESQRPTHRPPSQNGHGHRSGRGDRRKRRNRDAQQRVRRRCEKGGCENGHFPQLSDTELLAQYQQGPVSLAAAFEKH